MTFSRSTWRPLLGALVTLLLATACGNPADNVTERAEGRWAALLEQDYMAAYEFLTPGYRSSVTREAYMRQMLLKRVGWKAVDVLAAECEAERCSVEVSISYIVRNPVPGVDVFENTQNATETWIRSGGEWYFLPSK